MFLLLSTLVSSCVVQVMVDLEVPAQKGVCVCVDIDLCMHCDFYSPPVS